MPSRKRTNRMSDETEEATESPCEIDGEKRSIKNDPDSLYADHITANGAAFRDWKMHGNKGEMNAGSAVGNRNWDCVPDWMFGLVRNARPSEDDIGCFSCRTRCEQICERIQWPSHGGNLPRSLDISGSESSSKFSTLLDGCRMV